MNAYQGLAGAYDSLTGDVAYEKRADYLESSLPAAASRYTRCWILPVAPAP
ncbi:MAG: hypothetical protein ACLUNQ_02115 [Oscillospiraceae bacterium]